MELGFFLITVFLLAIFGAFIGYAWNIPLGFIGILASLLLLMVYKRLVAVEAQVSEEQRSFELWRQEHPGANIVIYIIIMALAVGSAHFTCDKYLKKEMEKKETSAISPMESKMDAFLVKVSVLENSNREIKELCSNIKGQQEKTKQIEAAIAEIGKKISEAKLTGQKEKESWSEKLDKTNENLLSAIKQIGEIKTAQANLEKKIKELSTKEIMGELEKIKRELEKNRKTEIYPLTSTTPAIPATPNQPQPGTKEENK